MVWSFSTTLAVGGIVIGVSKSGFRLPADVSDGAAFQCREASGLIGDNDCSPRQPLDLHPTREQYADQEHHRAGRALDQHLSLIVESIRMGIKTR